MTVPFTDEQLSLLFGKTSNLVFLMERSGESFTYRYINPAARELFGKDIVGTTVAEAAPAKLATEVRGHYSRALATGRIITYRDYNLFTEEAAPSETTVTPMRHGGDEYVLAVTENVSGRKKMEEDYLFFQALIRHSVDPMIVILEDETIYMSNESFDRQFTKGGDSVAGRPLMELPGITESNAAYIRGALKDAKTGEESVSVPIKCMKSDGSPANFLASCTLIREHGKMRVYFIVLSEFTEQFQLKKELQDTLSVLESYKKALNYSALVALSDPEGILLHVNDNYTEATGYSHKELIGSSIAEADKEFLAQEEVRAVRDAVDRGEIWRGQIRQRTKQDEDLWMDATIIPLKDGAGRTHQVLSIRFDITAKKQAESKLEHMAYHDSLTQLPNRRSLLKAFPEMKAKADEKERLIGVLYIDGDNFKAINDRYGHETGDTFIYEFGRALKKSIGTNDMVGRIGGDEFLILLADLPQDSAVQHIHEASRRIRENLESGWVADNVHFAPAASIGAAVYPVDGNSLDELVKSGDAALMEAKKQGKNRTVLFSELNLSAQ